MLVYQRVVALSKTSRLQDFLCIPSGDPLLGWKRRENTATKCKDPILYLHGCTNRCGSGFVHWLFEGKILEIETWYTLQVQRLCIFFWVCEKGHHSLQDVNTKFLLVFQTTFLFCRSDMTSLYLGRLVEKSRSTVRFYTQHPTLASFTCFTLHGNRLNILYKFGQHIFWRNFTSELMWCAVDSAGFAHHWSWARDLSSP